MNKKKIIIILISGVILLIVLFFVLILFKSNQQTKIGINSDLSSEIFTPEFLTDKEKVDFGMTTDLKIQAVSRNSSGEVMVYKIIRKDSDIVNPKKIN